MKNIRIDFYRYRLRKGRADVLLQRDEDGSCYRIPYRYVEEKEMVAGTIRRGTIEDDANGDLVILDYTLNDCHLGKKDKEWIQLGDIMKTDLLRNEFSHVYQNIFSYFLVLCPEEEPRIRRSVSEMLEAVKVDIAKQEYVASLRKALVRKYWIVLDGNMTPPDPELIKKEIETLEHFRLYKIEDRYSYEPIDWEEFGAEIKMFPRFPRRFSPNPFTDEIDNLEEE